MKRREIECIDDAVQLVCDDLIRGNTDLALDRLMAIHQLLSAHITKGTIKRGPRRDPKD